MSRPNPKQLLALTALVALIAALVGVAYGLLHAQEAFAGDVSPTRLQLAYSLGGFTGGLLFLLAVLAALGFVEADAVTARSRPRFSGVAAIAGLRCAFCHDLFTAAAMVCSGCATHLHDLCVEEAGGCVTLGCGGRA